MAQFDSAKGEYPLIISNLYCNQLDVEGFSKMLKDPSYCYKYYWLEALVQLISMDRLQLTFDDVINEMIASAWYSVREFRIHLSGFQNGEVRDGLERTILQLSELSKLPAYASKTEIQNAIHTFDRELREYKVQLTNMVPYRALAGFFLKCKDTPNWGSPTKMVAYIEHVNRSEVLLPYTLGPSSTLKKEIYIHTDWARMIQDHTVSILGWIQFEKVKWLQMNNPEVPGIVYKLAPLDEKMRKLQKVRDLWNGILENQSMPDVFTARPIEKNAYDVDHFIPWSFVMNDELWNLMPMDSSLNSSKSNRLPLWDPFFDRFAENQYALYQQIHNKPYIHRLYESCYKDNLHSLWATQELFKPGNEKTRFINILQENMKPIYESAHRQGYEIWNCG